jgi:hypothetical protein
MRHPVLGADGLPQEGRATQNLKETTGILIVPDPDA